MKIYIIVSQIIAGFNENILYNFIMGVSYNMLW